jgi:hypothetical protein
VWVGHGIWVYCWVGRVEIASGVGLDAPFVDLLGAIGRHIGCVYSGLDMARWVVALHVGRGWS